MTESTDSTHSPDSTTPTDHKIRERAFQLWQEAGCPEGRAEEFWHLAQAAETNPEDLPPGDTQNFA